MMSKAGRQQCAMGGDIPWDRIARHAQHACDAVGQGGGPAPLAKPALPGLGSSWPMQRILSARKSPAPVGKRVSTCRSIIGAHLGQPGGVLAVVAGLRVWPNLDVDVIHIGGALQKEGQVHQRGAVDGRRARSAGAGAGLAGCQGGPGAPHVHGSQLEEGLGAGQWPMANRQWPSAPPPRFLPVPPPLRLASALRHAA